MFMIKYILLHQLYLTNELLTSMNEAHPKNCGEVIKLILPAVLEDPHLALSQFASSIAIRLEFKII